jgi:multidrug efflux pump subunit AcrA (membrane-fusion protein)
MTERSGAPWLNYLLGTLCVGAILAAYLTVGPTSQTAAQSRTVTVQRGVVQSTVSGAGNIQANSQLNLGFKTSGVVTHIYVTQGAQVTPGQLLATLNPESAEVTLEQAKASLQAAEANLAHEEEDGGENSSSTGQSSAGVNPSANTANVASAAAAASTTPSSSNTPSTSTTAPSVNTPSTNTTPSSANTPSTTRRQPTSTSTPTTSTPAQTTKQTESAATREANLASARAAVKSDRLTVQSDEEAVSDTKLYAPESGTIVSLSGEVGETVSATGTTKATSASSSSSGSGSGSSGTGTATRLGGGASTGSSASASSGSGSASSSSSFAVLSDLSSMELVVPLSESEIGSVKDGQPATVTVEALESRKLAAEVLDVATLPTSNSGVVSYDVTFQLDQTTSGLKPGMSASAEVVVKQAEGVNVPTTAISGGSVTVIRAGKQVRQPVVSGLAGNNSTLILSGLKAGEQIALPVASTSAGGAASRLGVRTSGALGGSALGGGGFAGGGFAGGGFAGGGGFRGGGGRAGGG